MALNILRECCISDALVEVSVKAALNRFCVICFVYLKKQQPVIFFIKKPKLSPTSVRPLATHQPSLTCLHDVDLNGSGVQAEYDLAAFLLGFFLPSYLLLTHCINTPKYTIKCLECSEETRKYKLFTMFEQPIGSISPRTIQATTCYPPMADLGR